MPKHTIPLEHLRQEGISVPTGERHVIVLQRSSWIEVQLLTAQGAPRSDVRCVFKLPDGSSRSAVSDPEGLIRLDMTPHRGEATLVLPEYE